MVEVTRLICAQLTEAACDPAAWPTALGTINSFLNASGAALLSVDERLRHAPTSPDLADLMADYFDNGWYANDRREGCRPLLLRKGVALDYEFLDASKLERCYGDYYTKFLAKHNRKWFVGLGANLEGDLWCLAVQRSADKGPFETADLPRLTFIRAQLEETAAYARMVSRRWMDGALAAFAHEESAAIVLDRSGRILELSSAARALLGSRAASSEVRVSPGVGAAFGQVLRSQAVEVLRSPGKSRRIHLRIGSEPYTLEASGLTGIESLAFSRASVLIRISPHAAGPGETLKQRYGLTDAEVRVSMALAAGYDVKAMADMFEVAANTIRAQLKGAYAKTNTGNQAKLVSFVNRMNPGQ